MFTVSGAKFTKNFGRFRTEAHKQPVVVTSHGKEDLVVLDVAEYRRLKANDRQAMFAWQLEPADIDALRRDDIPAHTREFDDELD